MKRKILVATTNPGKVEELRAMLDDNIQWLGLADFPNVAEIEEDGLTFAENARKKAAGYAKQTGIWTIADDSGLLIDALDGAPGVKSARFSQDQRLKTQDLKQSIKCRISNHESRITSHDRTLLDRKNMTKVLKLLEDVPAEKRTAKFVCCLSLASPEKILIETEGTLEGFIAEKPIGENGFGYDPIFFVPHLNKTTAQLTAKEKNAISHRGNAIRKLKLLLEQFLE